MAVTLSTRPAAWSAVKNPVVYKFTSTGHGALVNYRIEVEVFRASDNTSLTGGVKFSFSPDSGGISYADISTIVKAYLKSEWTWPGNVVSAIDTDTSLRTYIKYQELYDGSATSVVDDVANPIVCVLGAKQIGDANVSTLTDYVMGDSTKKFLTKLDRPKVWRNPASPTSVYAHSYSMLLPAGYSDIKREITQFRSDGVQLVQDYNTLTLNTNAVNRFTMLNPSLPLLHESAASVKVKKLGVVLQSGSGSGATADRTEVVMIGSTIVAPYPYKFYLVANQNGVPEVRRIEINVNDGVDIMAVLKDTGSVSTSILDVDEMSAYITPTANFDRFHVRYFRTSANTYSWSYTVGIYLEIAETKTYDVADPCDNPIMLVWKNSLGGDSFWIFEYSQEAGYNYAGSKKAKRMTLFAEHLTLNQWEALNELNTLGEVYKENIIELTSSVNKTHKRDGAQVYVVDVSGTTTGVIVIPTNSVINTKDVSHSIEIEIEYPEVTQ